MTQKGRKSKATKKSQPKKTKTGKKEECMLKLRYLLLKGFVSPFFCRKTHVIVLCECPNLMVASQRGSFCRERPGDFGIAAGGAVCFLTV